jgi:error-prone DNA polymerase
MTSVVSFPVAVAEPKPRRARSRRILFAELGVTTNFSFLRGASHPEELVQRAADLGFVGVGIADRNSVAGVVRGYSLVKSLDLKIRYVVGARLVFRDGTPDIVAWPKDRPAWGRLCRLLTEGNRRAPKGECHLDLADLEKWGEGMMLGIVPPADLDEKFAAFVAALAGKFPGHVRLLASFTYGTNDRRRMARLSRIAHAAGAPLMATNDVHYHAAGRRPLQDVLTCVREKTTLAGAGFHLAANAERHLKSPQEMARLFAAYPEAIAETIRVLKKLKFSLKDLEYNYPNEPAGDFPSPQAALVHYAYEGARFRYPEGVPDQVKRTLAHEISLIEERKYAPYFLTVHEIVKFARSQGILCQGRGSAANSAVCFCLGITEVDPSKANLLFARFLSPNRNEPPDIDVDFEHERREIVMQHIYEKYSRDRAGIAATVITYRTRSAIRDVGKVFGLSEDVVGALASTTWGWSSEGVAEKEVRRAGLDPQEATMAKVLELCRALIGFPRHLSQHVGGFVMTNDRLDEMVPIMNAAMEDRTFVEWDKDDLDALKMLKVDVLALGMLTCIRRAFEFLEQRYGETLTLATIPKEDPAVYRMLQRADSIGVFQVESRAQMSMLPRLKPDKFYDLVIEVAIVRPGPIQGDMVHPYLRRREGIEKVEYPGPSREHGDRNELRKILERTLGVPLFQEQAMQIAMDAAKFTAAEADGLRRSMATFRRNGTIGNYQKRMVEGMVARGYTKEFAERSFRQIEGFGDYGFPESHAASFALLVYASAWLKAHYPDVFCAALLDSQPMGFYAPAQIVRDAERHGVTVLPPDVNRSEWYSTLELPSSVVPAKAGTQYPPSGQSWALKRLPDARPPNSALHPLHADMRADIHTRYAVRLGFHRIKAFREDDAARLVAARARGYDSVRDVWLRTGLDRAAIERLADGDSFRSVGLDRRDALWAARGEGALKEKDRLPLFDIPEHADIRREPDFALSPMLVGEHVVNDYRYLALSLKAHPLEFLRRDLAARGIIPASRLRGDSPAGDGATTRGEDGRRPDREQTRGEERRRRDREANMNGKHITVAGLVITRQRPGTASGVIFMTLEDETDIINAIVWPKVFEKFRPVVLGARLTAITGKVQSEKGVIHVIADRLDDLTPMLATLSADAHDLQSLARADEVARPPADDHRSRARHPRNVRFFEKQKATATHAVMPKGRNFH